VYFLGRNISVNNTIGFTTALRNLQSGDSEIVTLILPFPAAIRVTDLDIPSLLFGYKVYKLCDG